MSLGSWINDVSIQWVSCKELTFSIDYVVLHTWAIANAYPLLLGRPWLFQSKAVHNWRKGTLTILDGAIQVKLAVHSLSYSQNYPDTYSDITSTQDDTSREREFESMGINVINENTRINPNAPTTSQFIKQEKMVIKKKPRDNSVKRMYVHPQP